MSIAVIDFETTGSSPNQGARATEIAAVLVEGDRIVDQYQSLMYSGAWVPPFIEQLTGITNEMLADAPPAEHVMGDVLRFTSGFPLVAHNAAFDRAFWVAEARRAGLEEQVGGPFACTVRLSRRLFPKAPNHRLGTLASYCQLPNSGRAHRALADARTAAHLLVRLRLEVAARLGASELAAVDHGLLCRVQAWPCARVGEQMEKCRDATGLSSSQ